MHFFCIFLLLFSSLFAENAPSQTTPPLEIKAPPQQEVKKAPADSLQASQTDWSMAAYASIAALITATGITLTAINPGDNPSSHS